MSGQIRTIDVIKRTRFNRPCRGRTCGQPITWFRTWPRGRWICFNADPVAVRTRVEATAHGRDTIEELDAADVHWVSCPDIKDFKP